MEITEISIKNIKGLDDKAFTVTILPNKPSLLIAPNGFGKSSIATAFGSMNSKRIILKDEDYYKQDLSNQPELSIIVSGKKLVADG